MVLEGVVPQVKEAFVVGFLCAMVVVVGVAVYQYAEDAGSVIVLAGILGIVGYAFYVWQLQSAEEE